MGTDIYMGVTVTDAPEDLLSQLPNFELLETENWGALQDYDKAADKFVDVPNGYYLYGVGRYDDEQNIIRWILEFTEKHPAATVMHSLEWHADEGGIEENVYRAGALVREESKVNGMLPLDLHLLVDKALAALGTTDPMAVREALIALVDKLV